MKFQLSISGDITINKYIYTVVGILTKFQRKNIKHSQYTGINTVLSTCCKTHQNDCLLIVPGIFQFISAVLRWLIYQMT